MLYFLTGWEGESKRASVRYWRLRERDMEEGIRETGKERWKDITHKNMKTQIEVNVIKI